MAALELAFAKCERACSSWAVDNRWVVPAAWLVVVPGGVEVSTDSAKDRPLVALDAVPLVVAVR